MSILAFHSQEERYSTLNLEFSKQQDKEKIVLALESMLKISDLKPEVTYYANSITLEFKDDYDKVGGDFYTKILKKLDIKECEKDTF